MVRWLHVVCKCHSLTAERKVWVRDARWELVGTRLRVPEDIKVYLCRLKKCQASHARHVGHMFIMRRRRHCGPTAGSVPLLSIRGRCRGVGWGPKKVRCTTSTVVRMSAPRGGAARVRANIEDGDVLGKILSAWQTSLLSC